MDKGDHVGRVWATEEALQKIREEGIRDNKGKLQWSLVDYRALEPMVRVLEFGAKKYSRDNWQLPGDQITQRTICESMLRHIYAFLAGENTDKESGISHGGHIMCNAMFLSHYIQNNKNDDRAKDNRVEG